MATRTMKRIMILAFILVLMLGISAIGWTISSHDNLPVGLEDKGGVTSISELDVQMTPVKIVPESALRYIGDD